MKYFKILIVALLLFTVQYAEAQMKNGFAIQGNIKGLKAGSKLCLLIKRSGKIDTLSKAIATKDAFQFKNVKLSGYPDFYLLCLQTEFVENLNLFLDQAGDVRINGDLKSWLNVLIAGSQSHADYQTYLKLRDVAWKEFDSLQNARAPEEAFVANNRRARIGFIEKHPESVLNPYLILTWLNAQRKAIDPEVKKGYYDQFSQKVKDTYYGKALATHITEGMEYKSRRKQLEAGVIGLSSISNVNALKELEDPGGNAEGKVLPLSKTTDGNLKVKAATLVVGMAYDVNGQKGVNPTTAYVIDASGICVTNYHVVKEYGSGGPYQTFMVMTAEGKTYPIVKILAASESDDLAIFQVDNKGDQLAALPLGENEAVGSDVHVMAHPIGKFYHFTSGKVSDYSTLTLAGKPCNIMNITADFNVGSSGGPIVDQFGNVVGTVSRIDGGMKVGVPVSELKKLIDFKK
jgi:hypothetical protein